MPDLAAPYIQRGIVEMLLLAVIAGVLGTWVVLRRLPFYTHAIGTATFPGLVVAGPWGVPAQLTALVCAVGFGGVLERLQRTARIDPDAAIGLLLVAALAVGVVLASDVYDSGAGVDRLLFGSLIALTPLDLWLTAAAAAVGVLACDRALRRSWLATGFDADGARAGGVRTALADRVLLVAVAVAVVVALDAVGALLVTVVLTVPAATVRLFEPDAAHPAARDVRLDRGRGRRRRDRRRRVQRRPRARRWRCSAPLSTALRPLAVAAQTEGGDGMSTRADVKDLRGGYVRRRRRARRGELRRGARRDRGRARAPTAAARRRCSGPCSGSCRSAAGEVVLDRAARVRAADRAGAAGFPRQRARRRADGRVRADAVVQARARADRAAADAALDRVGLADRAGDRFGTLSGGQRQRVLIARALVQDARVLLLDEPLSGVDRPSAAQIERVFGELQAEGRALLVATHDVGQARALDRVLCLNRGQVAFGSPADVLTTDVLAETYGDELVILDGGSARPSPSSTTTTPTDADWLPSPAGSCSGRSSRRSCSGSRAGRSACGSCCSGARTRPSRSATRCCPGS